MTCMCKVKGNKWQQHAIKCVHTKFTWKSRKEITSKMKKNFKSSEVKHIQELPKIILYFSKDFPQTFELFYKKINGHNELLLFWKIRRMQRIFIIIWPTVSEINYEINLPETSIHHISCSILQQRMETR